MNSLGEWLESNSRKAGSRIVLAVDVVDSSYAARLARAVSLVTALKGRIVAVKVNWHLLLPLGVLGLRGLVEACDQADLPLIADMKLNDIGSTNVEAVQTLFSNGFDAVIASPFVGYKEGIEEILVRSREMHKALILLAYMSHGGAPEGYGLKVEGEPLYLRFAREIRAWGADGAVVSAKSPQVIREVRAVLKREQLILSPGVGFQGGDAREALDAGSDYLIVGRSIIEAKDPVTAADALNRDLKGTIA